MCSMMPALLLPLLPLLLLLQVTFLWLKRSRSGRCAAWCSVLLTKRQTTLQKRPPELSNRATVSSGHHAVAVEDIQKRGRRTLEARKKGWLLSIKSCFLFFKIISLQSLVGGPGALIGWCGLHQTGLAEKFGKEKKQLQSWDWQAHGLDYLCLENKYTYFFKNSCINHLI